MTPTSEMTYLNKAIENCNKCGGWLYRFELTSVKPRNTCHPTTATGIGNMLSSLSAFTSLV